MDLILCLSKIISSYTKNSNTDGITNALCSKVLGLFRWRGNAFSDAGWIS